MHRIIDYLEREYGLLRERAREMCRNHATMVACRMAIGSFPYYIANEVWKAELKRLGTDIPDDWFDPNWIEQSEENEENETDDYD